MSDNDFARARRIITACDFNPGFLSPDDRVYLLARDILVWEDNETDLSVWDDFISLGDSLPERGSDESAPD